MLLWVCGSHFGQEPMTFWAYFQILGLALFNAIGGNSETEIKFHAENSEKFHWNCQNIHRIWAMEKFSPLLPQSHLTLTPFEGSIFAHTYRYIHIFTSIYEYTYLFIYLFFYLYSFDLIWLQSNWGAQRFLWKFV